MAGRNQRKNAVIDARIVERDEDQGELPSDSDFDVSQVPTTWRSMVRHQLVPIEIAERLTNEVDSTAQEIQLVWDGQPMAVRRAIGFFYPDFLIGLLAEFRPIDVLIRASIPPTDNRSTPVNFAFVVPKAVAEKVLPTPAEGSGGLGMPTIDASKLTGDLAPLAPFLQMMMQQQDRMFAFMREMGTEQNRKWATRADGLQDLAFEHLRGVIKSAASKANVEPVDPSTELDRSVDRAERLMATAIQLPERLAGMLPAAKGDGGFTLADLKSALTSDEAKGAGRALIRALGGELPEPPNDTHRQLAERGDVEPAGSTPPLFKAPKVQKA